MYFISFSFVSLHFILLTLTLFYFVGLGGVSFLLFFFNYFFSPLFFSSLPLCPTAEMLPAAWSKEGTGPA